MADSSWDNGGQGLPAKTGLPTWGKVLLGCGVVSLLVLGTCVGGIAYLGHRVKKDPDGFKNKVLGFALEKVRPEWDDFQTVVDQLRSPERSRALYAANPDLAKTWPTEAAFLEATSTWRKELPPRTELSTNLMEHQGLQINRVMGGKVSIGWSPRSGRAVYVTFDRPRKAGDRSPRKVVELEVR